MTDIFYKCEECNGHEANAVDMKVISSMTGNTFELKCSAGHVTRYYD